VTTLSIDRSAEARTWALQDGSRLLAYLQLARFGASSGEVRRDDVGAPGSRGARLLLCGDRSPAPLDFRRQSGARHVRHNYLLAPPM
jgi:hypothetical protein